MHALTCDLLDINTYGFAMIPTYYRPDRFIVCKVYIEYVWHFEQSTFYHVAISELLEDSFESIKQLSTAYLRCINRHTGKPCMQHLPFVTTLSKESMHSQILSWHKDFVIDVPAPFIVKTKEQLTDLKAGIKEYFNNLANEI